MFRLVLAFFGLFATAAHTAEISASVGNDGVAVITITGELALGDEARFLQMAMTHQKAIVVLAGPGGNLRAALDIGRAIRLREYPTVVQANSVCASACAFAWIAGKFRASHRTALIGFHAASLNGEVASAGNALIGSYLNSLGLSDVAVTYLTSAQPNEMSWLTPERARLLGIAVYWGEPEQQGAPPLPRAPAPSPSPSNTEAQWRQRVSDTRAFVQKHVTVSEKDETSIRDHIVSHYPERFTRDTTERQRAEMLDETLRFTRRWPVRSYRLVPDTLNVRCTATSDTCNVSYEMAWSLTNPQRRLQSVGTSRVELLVLHGPYRPVIQWEKGQRLTSNTTNY